jgi:hypothetical protein
MTTIEFWNLIVSSTATILAAIAILLYIIIWYKKIVFSKENLAKFLKLIDGFNIIEINPNELSFLTNGKKKDFETIGFVCPIRTRFFITLI